MQRLLLRICVCSLVFFCSLGWVRGQHYVFIESDGQPFYVKKAGKLYSSSLNGFLIIPKVADSTVAFTVGFPRNQYPELSFEFALLDKDRAFQLRNLNEKGWILFDRSSMETIEVGKREEIKKEVVQEDKKGFADVLMEVTGDTTLVSKTVEQKIDKKLEVAAVKPEVKLDPPAENKQVIIVKNDTVEEKVDVEIDTTEQAIKPKPVNAEIEKPKVKEESVAEKKEEKTGVSEQSQKEVSKVVPVKSEEQKLEKKEDKGEGEPKPQSAAPVENKVQSAGKSIRSCASPFASDKDVKALKKKMIGIVSDQDIVNAVIKAMGERCYSCRQLAELSWLFTDETVRLKLFQRAYTWVADPDKFADLESTLVQDATIAAFRKIMSSAN
ncbi:MAG: hypothetical protein RL131_591 [Bacteroidota bacterium]